MLNALLHTQFHITKLSQPDKIVNSCDSVASREEIPEMLLLLNYFFYFIALINQCEENVQKCKPQAD